MFCWSAIYHEEWCLEARSADQVLTDMTFWAAVFSDRDRTGGAPKA